MNNIQKSYKDSDVIKRLFRKMRGDHEMIYEFTCHAGVLQCSNICTNEVLNCFPVLRALVIYMERIMMLGYEEQELGCSDCDMLAGLNIEEVQDAETVYMAHRSEYEGQGFRQHAICQDYFLKNDPTIMCYELPVFDNERSGFIDLIRYKDEKIYIMDFKPNAHKEKFQKVGSQLMNYKKLLQHQLRIPSEAIICQYFDNQNIYQITN
jgi:hypothetical protein